MKKNYLKKLMCTVLTAVCVATTVVPVMADDGMVTAEAATKNVTSAYKYHLKGYNKKGKPIGFSKASFYKDLNSLPTVKVGKTAINIPAASNSVKSISAEKKRPRYMSFFKFKAPKTGKYVITFSNLQGTDDKTVRTMIHCGIYKPTKDRKKSILEDLYPDNVGDYDSLYENNYLDKLRVILDNYKEEHPEYEYILEDDYNDEAEYVNSRPVDKIKFTTKLKKGQTYVFVIDNAGMLTTVEPYHDDAYLIDSKSCLWGGNYMAAYSFDLDIQFKK